MFVSSVSPSFSACHTHPPCLDIHCAQHLSGWISISALVVTISLSFLHNFFRSCSLSSLICPSIRIIYYFHGIMLCLIVKAWGGEVKTLQLYYRWTLLCQDITSTRLPMAYKWTATRWREMQCFIIIFPSSTLLSSYSCKPILYFHCIPWND